MMNVNTINNLSIELKATRDNFDLFSNFIESCLSKAGIINHDNPNILLASEEIIVNIIDYAFLKDKGNLLINFSHNDNKIEISFTDSGQPFNPLELPETDINLPLEERGLGGYGVLIVKKLMDSVLYENINGKNHLTIIKHIHK